MKKFLGFIMMAMFMALPLVFSGCSDDDENVSNITASDIVGTWRIVSSHILAKENGKVVQDEVDKEVGHITVFTQSGNKQEGIMAGTGSHGGFDNGSWKLAKGILYILTEEDFDEDEGWWIPYNIKDFTGDRMTLLCDYTFREGSYSANFYVKVVFERVK